MLFDVDGTLVDPAGAGRRAMEQAFAAVFGLRDVARRGSAVRYAGSTDPHIILDLARALGIGSQRVRASFGELEAAYLETLERELATDGARARVLPGVVPLLKELDHRSGVYLGLVTGNIERGARIKLERFGLNRFFADGGFASDHPDRREIARFAREKAARRAGIDFAPAEVTVVGDTVRDVECARVNGYRSIALTSGWEERGVLAVAGADALLDGLADMPAVLDALGLAPAEGDGGGVPV